MEITANGIYAPRMAKLGDRIRAAREAAGLSQSELGRRLGLSSQSVNMWEHSKANPSRNNLQQAAIVMGVTIDWLMRGSELSAQSVVSKVPPTGRHLPMFTSTSIASGATISDAQDTVFARFPCGPASYAHELENDSGGKSDPPGSIWIVDPDAPPMPGKFVIAVCGSDNALIYGRLRFEATRDGVVTIVTPNNPSWPEQRSDVMSVSIHGVRTERIFKD